MLYPSDGRNPSERRWPMAKYHVPKGYRLIFRAWYTDRNGNRVYARDQGKRGWPLLVPVR